VMTPVPIPEVFRSKMEEASSSEAED
jgi:hypothetical protein